MLGSGDCFFTSPFSLQVGFLEFLCPSFILGALKQGFFSPGESLGEAVLFLVLVILC